MFTKQLLGVIGLVSLFMFIFAMAFTVAAPAFAGPEPPPGEFCCYIMAAMILRIGLARVGCNCTLISASIILRSPRPPIVSRGVVPARRFEQLMDPHIKLCR